MALNARKNLKKDGLATNISLCSIVVYIDNRQYNKYINSKIDFYLLLELSSENRKSLLKIIEDCLSYTHFRGIIFVVNKNEIIFNRLFFLKDITLRFFQNDKKVGIWGIPYCVIQSILGGHNFSQLADKMILENSDQYSKYIPVNQYHSSLLLECHKCIASNACDGLGIREENQQLYGGRVSHKYRMIGRDELFKTDNSLIQKMYNSFSKHIDKSDLTYADRYMYFIKNIDYGSSYSFTDRFVYHCDFLPLRDYEEELSFLDTYIENKNFLPKINELASKGEIAKIAYSKAQNSATSRESFYVAPHDQNNDYLLHYFNIDLDVKFSYKLYGVGVDFYNGEIKSYKVYMMIPPDTILKMFPQYCEKIGIDLYELSEKLHYYVARLDNNKRLISERIDLVYNEKDLSFYEAYLAQASFTKDIAHKFYIYTFAFEFEDMDIKKMNIYYRNRF